jgi:ankyrin repeat protein
MQLLVRDRRVDPNCWKSDIFSWAVKGNHIELIRSLIWNGRASPDVNNNEPLRVAFMTNQTEIAKLLISGTTNKQRKHKHSYTSKISIQIDVRVEASANNQQCLSFAINNGNVDLVHLLMTCLNVDPTINDWELISNAILKNRIEIIDVLLQHPKIQNEIEDGFQRSLKFAIIQGRTEIAKLFMKQTGFDPCLNNNELLKIACEKGIVFLLYVVLFYF